MHGELLSATPFNFYVTITENSILFSQVKDISNQLAKLAEPDTTAKFIRNPDHRGYLMMYPEVLPVYTSSKFSPVDPLVRNYSMA